MVCFGGGTFDPVYPAKFFLKPVRFVLAGKDKLESSSTRQARTSLGAKFKRRLSSVYGVYVNANPAHHQMFSTPSFQASEERCSKCT